MTKTDKEQMATDSSEQAGKISYWDALVAEGFVPARVSKQVIVREGYPEVPLARYRKGRSKDRLS